MELLPIAQFVYNDQQYSVTGTTLFFVNYSRNLCWEATAAGSGTPTNIKKLTAMHKEIKTTIKAVQQATSHHLNNKKLKEPTLERRDKVYLSTKNLYLK